MFVTAIATVITVLLQVCSSIDCPVFDEDGPGLDKEFDQLKTRSQGTWDRVERQLNQALEKAGKGARKDKVDRKKIFKERISKINQQNKKADKTWCAGPNELSALDEDEIAHSFAGTKIGDVSRTAHHNPTPEDREKAEKRHPLSDGVGPANATEGAENGKHRVKRGTYYPVDHRYWTGPVTYQGSCGNCWAHTASSAATYVYRRLLGINIDGSEEQLTKCTYENDGCSGGFPTDAFDFLKTNELLDDSAYPRGLGTCQRSSFSNLTPHITGWRWVEGHGWQAIDSTPSSSRVDSMKFWLQRQPLAIAMRVSDPGNNFMSYTNGVWDWENPTCTDVDHGMTIVGWGNDPVGGDYWILKNSWGTWWGENGFIRVKMGKNLCNVEATAHFPVEF